MTNIEQLLRDTLNEQAAQAPRADPELFDRALAVQRGRRRRAVSVLSAAAVVGGIVGGFVGLGAAGSTDAPVASTAAGVGEAGGMSVAEQQTQLAGELGITDPPEVPVIRLVVPEEKGELVEQCLIARGWTALEDGYTFFTYEPEDEAAWNLDNYICMSSYPIDPDRGGTWTDAQTAIQYDWTINTVLPCLDALGYTITVPPPSREEFIATWWEDPYFPFAYIEGITALSNQETALLNTQCPQEAPTDQLWN
jgi:hypothetical protein